MLSGSGRSSPPVGVDGSEARLQGLHLSRVIAAGELPAVRLRRSVRVARADLDAYIKARREIR
jgi:excisionase family DNA binding protein